MLAYKDHNDRWREWHVGDGGVPPEILHGRVVQVQADGHELTMLINAMKLSYIQSNGDVAFARHDYTDID